VSRDVGEVFGERVERFRRNATPTPEELAARPAGQRGRDGLTQEELAARTEAIGVPLSRVAIANIEAAGRPDSENKNRTRGINATLTDVLALAIALDVPPALMFVPLGDLEEVTIGNLRFHPHLLFEWVAGEVPPAPSPDRVSLRVKAWGRNAATLYLFKQLRMLQNSTNAADMRLREADPAQQPEAQRVFDRRLRELDRFLVAMAVGGLSTPDMPDEWAIRMTDLRSMPEDDQ
jgi:transcriptional regulator with XRE-family HTH domain